MHCTIKIKGKLQINKINKHKSNEHIKWTRHLTASPSYQFWPSYFIISLTNMTLQTIYDEHENSNRNNVTFYNYVALIRSKLSLHIDNSTVLTDYRPLSSNT